MDAQIAAALVAAPIAILGIVAQLFIANRSSRAESERQDELIGSQFRSSQYAEWQKLFVPLVADLMEQIDPDIVPRPQVTRVSATILRLQMLLNLRIESHLKVHQLATQIGLHVRDAKPSGLHLLTLSGHLLEAARQALFLPGR